MYRRFAWRYFRSKRSTNAINIISWVSILAVAVGTAALIILLSVFNGLEGFIKGLYNSFDPDIKITAIEGKSFFFTNNQLKQLSELEGIRAISPTMEEKVLLTYNNEQTIAILKGVNKAYNQVNTLKESVQYGEMDFSKELPATPIVLGLGLANKLGVSEQTPLPIGCFAFRNVQSYNLNALNAYSEKNFMVQGVFYLQEELDNKYALAPLEIVQKLLGREDQYSALEIAVKDSKQLNNVKQKILSFLKDKNLKAETRFEQNKTLFLILRSERWAVYAVLTLMLIIASFNIIGTLAMLVLEKENDIAILKAMGATPHMIRKIFLSTGVLLALIGAGIGASIAIIICLVQQNFGLVKMGSGSNFLLESYPVCLELTDILLVILTVISIAVLASYWPATKASEKNSTVRNG